VRNEVMPMHLIIDLARDLAIVAIELVALISLGWCLSRSSAGDKKFSSRKSFICMGESARR